MYFLNSSEFSSRTDIGLRKAIPGPFDSYDLPQTLEDKVVSVCVYPKKLATETLVFLATSEGLVIRLKISHSPAGIKVRHVCNRNFPVSHIAIFSPDPAEECSTNICLALFGKECDGEIILMKGTK